MGRRTVRPWARAATALLSVGLTVGAVGETAAAYPVRAAVVKKTTLAVPGKADIFAAGRSEVPALAGGGGVLPPKVAVGSHTVLTVTSVTGSVFCEASEQRTTTPNGPCQGVTNPTDVDSYNGISGIIDGDSNAFPVGVFLGKKVPATAPSRLDFSKSSLGTDFITLKPKIGQTFFIGTGRTASGSLHRYRVPAGATRLYLGLADAYYYSGTPAYYDDNGGRYTVTVRLR